MWICTSWRGAQTYEMLPLCCFSLPFDALKFIGVKRSFFLQSKEIN
jgi:hypothetical protein